MAASLLLSSSYSALFFVLAAGFISGSFAAGRIGLGSRLLAREQQAWISDNGTFAFGFTESTDDPDRFQLAIWFNHLPGDRITVWSPNRSSPVTKNAILELNTAGNLILTDNRSPIWISNSSGMGIESASMEESGNFILFTAVDRPAWQSFSHPSDTLLPNQPLTASLELTSRGGGGNYYSLKMLQQPNSLSLALTYNLPESIGANYSYWTGPDISNVTGEVLAVVDQAGSFGIVYGESSSGAVYVHKNDNDYNGLASATNQSTRRLGVIRRLILEGNGNLRLYRFDNDVNGSRQWVPEWAAVSNPCDIAGICGDGICNLDRSKTNASCTPLPGVDGGGVNSSSRSGCNSTELKIAAVQQTNYYFSDDYSVVANYSDVSTVSKCGEACLSDCECVASVYGLDDEKPYCWVLRSMDFGGYEDPGATLFVKVGANWSGSGHDGAAISSRTGKVVVLPIVLSMTFLIAMLGFLLCYNVRRKRLLKKEMDRSLLLSGAPVEFTFRDLQVRTWNFTQLLGTGGFGSVYKGSLGDGTLVAVKKLDKVLPHGEKEFITEVNTIGSMHHMNLVRLCGYCSEGPQRLLVYEFMKNGSLDKWIFPSSYEPRDKFVLDWPTRFSIAIATAQGIAYFHEQCRNRIIHCDIKPENILLDENFCPKVSDFGLAKLMGREHSHVVTMVRGTRGYLAPEWVSNRPITVKADVYSYGMLLLEIIGGRRNLDMSLDADDFFFPGWAFKAMMRGTHLKAVDRRLLEGSTSSTLKEDELLRALKVAFWCIQDEVFMRPSMGEAVKLLEGSTAEIKMPPMPQTVLELIEEGLEHVYRAMKRDYHHHFNGNEDLDDTTTNLSASHATCSYSTMSPR
ncbi:G-type lectin S-receptor-like serine/threonine-protein kinase At5g24080 [Linum perenne]